MMSETKVKAAFPSPNLSVYVWYMCVYIPMTGEMMIIFLSKPRNESLQTHKSNLFPFTMKTQKFDPTKNSAQGHLEP